MSQILQFFILLPLAGFLLSLVIPRTKERIISFLSISFIGIHLLGFFAFVVYWLMNGHPTIDIKHFTLFKAGSFEFFADLYFDKITAAFAAVGCVLTLLVTIFSRFYLHREEGFRRFFNTLLFFYLGYNIVIFSGNFETMFVGWEIIGISSFILIAFYRDRYLPVKNGFKAITLYRVSDVCLMLAMWMCHHLFHENITFTQLGSAPDHGQMFPLFISLMVLIAAVIKSAQLPFSTWLPRAMEGPTTSSAIFYGALSVNIGVFILLRTYPLWEDLLIMKVLIITIGALTGIVATSIARVQPTVKTQIAYSSIAQIGIIFIEVGMGWHLLALIHFAGNAFLRTYQLLVSPSVLSYLTHNQFYHFTPRKETTENPLLRKLLYSFYMLGIKEWNLDSILYRFVWKPFKGIGNLFSFLSGTWFIVVLLMLTLAGSAAVFVPDLISLEQKIYLPYIFSVLAVIVILKAFTDSSSAIRTWIFLFFGQCLLALSLSWNHQVKPEYLFFYLGGILVAGIIGYVCLHIVNSIDKDIRLTGFHGYVYERPGLSLVFLLCCLGMIGFPITPSFIGIDLMFSYIEKNEILLLILSSISLIFIELAILRIYLRIFLGQHKKPNHAMAYRSS